LFFVHPMSTEMGEFGRYFRRKLGTSLMTEGSLGVL
jgi:hypothetical protein